MDKVQQQLQEYRQRKTQQVKLDPVKSVKPNSNQSASSQIAESTLSTSPTSAITSNRTTIDADREQPHRQRSWIDALSSFLIQLLVWLMLLLVAVKYEFGIIYCILTGFYVIWINLGRRRRQTGELSAYSVFNPNLERLPGTLTAEQLESELLHRPM